MQARPPHLGAGPAITVKDRSYITPPRLLKHFIQTAETLRATLPIEAARYRRNRCRQHPQIAGRCAHDRRRSAMPLYSQPCFTHTKKRRHSDQKPG